MGGRDKLRKALSLPIGLAARYGSIEYLICFDVYQVQIASYRRWCNRFQRWRFYGWNWTWRSSDGVVEILNMDGTRGPGPYEIWTIPWSYFHQRRMYMTQTLLIDGPASDAEVLNFRTVFLKLSAADGWNFV